LNLLSKIKHEIIIVIAISIIVVATVAAFQFLSTKEVKEEEKEKTKWVYCGAITLPVQEIRGIKDPEFVRYPDHRVFRDSQGFYYIVASFFKTDGAWLTGVIKTKDLRSYTFVGFTPTSMDGKIAPYCIYNPDDGKFYLYYSDWKNTVDIDIRLARLGLAIGTDINSPSEFADHGYLTIENMPEILSPNLGWDPYIVKVDDVYYMLISAAKYEMHLATAKNLGTKWNYTKIAVTGTLENPTLFCLNSKWYMLVGIYNGRGYDLYSSEDLKYWNIAKKNFFRDENYSELPSGSTSLIVDGVFYHLYQVPLGEDRYELCLAYIKVEDLIAEINKVE
jgi:beta-xylosidase